MAFSNEILRKALDTVAARRKEAESRFAKKRQAVYAENPELLVIDEEMQKKASALALATLSGDTARASCILLELKSIRERRSAIAISAGMPEEPEYCCSLCHDTGYKDGALCQCVKELASKLSYSSLSGAMPIDKSTFESFDLTLYPEEKNSRGVSPRKQMTAVFKTCRSFAADFPSGANLLLTGGCGLGKTHLSLAIANEVIAKDHGVIYGSAQNLINEVSRETFDRSGSTDKIDSMTSCDLLILDDLGTEFSTQLSISVVYNIINTRLLKGLSTVISTNLDLKEISETYNDRIASRIVGSYTICPFFGNDIRQIKSVNRI